MSAPVVKVIMDSEKYIKNLVGALYLGGVNPDTMGLVLNYTAEAMKLDQEQAAEWITEEVTRLNLEAQDEETETEPTDEAPEEPGNKEA